MTRSATKSPLEYEEFASVWDAIADSPEEAANLRLRAELMRQLSSYIGAQGWTQVEAARRACISQPRINDLLRGRIARFSLDALVNLAAALGREVTVRLDDAA
jgi:predicted XRE-type DNA-binding protein